MNESNTRVYESDPCAHNADDNCFCRAKPLDSNCITQPLRMVQSTLSFTQQKRPGRTGGITRSPTDEATIPVIYNNATTRMFQRYHASTNGEKTRRSYTRELKLAAIQEFETAGRSRNSVATSIGVDTNNLKRWIANKAKILASVKQSRRVPFELRDPARSPHAAMEAFAYKNFCIARDAGLKIDRRWLVGECQQWYRENHPDLVVMRNGKTSYDGFEYVFVRLLSATI